MKAPFMIYANLEFECLLENVKIILKNLTQEKKLCIHLLVIQCLHIVHLTQQKTNLIFTEEKIVLNDFIRT